ncbi:MAG TPA: DUF998 domain-containing protein [Anaerolineales bacterium]|nr:DUF998 domain-containing protein [Anaerolineales bacterium]
MKAITKPVTEISLSAEQLSITASAAVLVLLASLHVLSPEFDPSWRMVSEYANGNYGWVLSLMFIAWGVSSWALAFAIWPQVRMTAGKIGLIFLIAAGVGEAMAAIFDINQPLHNLASIIGIPSLPIAAMLISASLVRTEEWSSARKMVLWTANLTWISVLLMAAAFAIFISTFIQSGGNMTSGAAPAVLPSGVIALVGWANRFLIVVYCVWIITVTR